MENKKLEALKGLSIKEKISFLRGINAWESAKDDRFNLKGVFVADTTSGIRKEVTKDLDIKRESEIAVSFPTASTLACSFDRDLLKEVGSRVANEARNKHVNVVLGPGINIKRNPLCGRNFEYFSEDPCLTGELAAAYIEGVEKTGVGTSLKHFAVNSMETERARINEVVDLRALHEIYLEGFKRAILKAKPGSVMSSYNKVNGYFASENKYLLKDVLRDMYHYDGLVVSDWCSLNDPVLAVKNGLDLEMPNAGNINFIKLMDAYNKGELSEEEIDVALNHVLDFIYKYQESTYTDISFKRDHEFAIKAAEESIVLLKNENNILPLKDTDSLLILGDLAVNPHFQGLGSAEINPYIGEDLFNNFKKHTSHFSYLKGYDDLNPSLNNKLLEEAKNAASNKNKILLYLGTRKNEDSEGYDLKDSKLSSAQLNLIKEIAKINQNIVVILESGNVKELSFIDDIKALIVTYLGGEGINAAITNILYNKVSPSGKLSETWFKDLKTHPAYNYLKTNLVDSIHKESIFVGYRYFNFDPSLIYYPFGYGISYASFKYQNFGIDKDYLNEGETLKLHVDILNDSDFDAKEVIQIYIKKPNDKVFNGALELKEFKKVLVAKHNDYRLDLELNYQDFAYFDISSHSFKVQKGNYKVIIAKDSLNYLAEFDVFVEGNDDNTFYEDKAKKYFSHDVLNLTDEEFKEIYPEVSLFDPNSKLEFDLNASINFAALYGSKGAKKIKKLILKIKQIKNNEMLQATIFSSPMRQLRYFVPIFSEEDIQLIVDVFNDKKGLFSLVKLGIKYLKNN